ncbi:MAG: alpha/beta fold hydrolase [Rhodanobacter sp.]|nr:MAG: alpha/beta fold hydrolase [Rhodanobacter sp.]TAM37548.1 MAG: alpha/beta fold hydrolase [Rhodanobacter sp.]
MRKSMLMGGVAALVAALAVPVAWAAAPATVEVAAPAPGALLWVQATAVPATLPHAATREVITYRSRGVHGEPIVVSGYALLPKDAPPKGGWPVLAWAHGTTGVTDTCAPSGDYVGGPIHPYETAMETALDWWLARGYAVVATDYQGLGTPGGHPYMDATSQLHTVDDAVRALHALRPGAFSKDWLVMGHSQGGAAALAVAAHGQADLPQYKLRGAITIAPGGYRYSAIMEYLKANPHPPVGVALFFPIMLQGAQAADPKLDVEQLISPDLQPLMNLAGSRCLAELRTEVKQAPATVFKPGADLAPLTAYLDRQAIGHLQPTVPVMFVQGSADQLVAAGGTQAYYKQICAAHATAFYHDVQGGSHGDALAQSPAAAHDFLAFLAGGHQLKTCAPVAGTPPAATH